MVTEDQFRQFALSFPEAQEKETWGEATFRVRDKMFASMSGRGASVKASLDDQAGLLQADPETFSVPHYVGRYGWVAIDLDRVAPEMARRLLDNAWRRTAPRRVIAAHDAGGAPRI